MAAEREPAWRGARSPHVSERVAQCELNLTLVVGQRAGDGRATVVIGITAWQPKLWVIE